jgi:cytochrome c oxidase subunit 3
VTTNPSNAFFYLLTGIHGLHILGGMYVWARATVRTFSDRDMGAVKHSVELCTIYWHFLLLVWLVLFGLMLST